MLLQASEAGPQDRTSCLPDAGLAYGPLRWTTGVLTAALPLGETKHSWKRPLHPKAALHTQLACPLPIPGDRCWYSGHTPTGSEGSRQKQYGKRQWPGTEPGRLEEAQPGGCGAEEL